MNEDQIADQLAAKAQARQQAQDAADAEGAAQRKANQAPPEAITEQKVNTLDSLTTYKLYDHFKVAPEHRDGNTAAKLGFMWNWAQKQAGSDDYFETAAVLRRLESSLGLQFKEDKLERIYRYIRLQQTQQAIDQEMTDIIS